MLKRKKKLEKNNYCIEFNDICGQLYLYNYLFMGSEVVVQY